LSFFPSHFFDFFPYFTDILGFFLFPTAAATAGVGIGNILFLCAFTFGSRVEVDSVLFGCEGSWVRARGWFLDRLARAQRTRGAVSTAQNQDPEEIGNRFLGVCPRSECRMKCEGRLTNDPSRARLTPVCSAHQLMTHDSSKDESDRASPDLTYPSCAREYRSCPGGAPSPLYPLAACLVMIDG
jgi:hypothetical protein